MVGCGRMGGALLKPWHRIPQFQFTTVSPSGRSVPDGVMQVRGEAELGDASYDLLVVAIKPQMIPEVLPAYAEHLRDGGVLVSLAAGVACARLQEVVPHAAVTRVMPNLPVALGRGVSGLYCAPGVSGAQRALVEMLMVPTGRVVHASCEDHLDRITAVAGSGPGFAFEILRAWSAAAEGLGFAPEEARELVTLTLSGATALAEQRGIAPQALRDEVTSKNGTTQAGLEALNSDGILDARFEATLQATYARAQELR